MRYGSIYVITNKHTGEQYVGQTIKSVQRRWYAHCISAKKPKFPISQCIAQYGKEAFAVEELFIAFDKTYLNHAEKQIIADLAPSLNRTSGGAGASRYYTPEECHKRSDAAKRRWANVEWREKTVQSIKAAAQTDAAKARGKLLNVDKRGSRARWAGHEVKIVVPTNRSELMIQQWKRPEFRALVTAKQKEAMARPEVKARISVANKGRVMSRDSVQRSARKRWKPVYCPELQTSFLSRAYAAEYLGVLRTSVSNAIKQKGKVGRKFTLIEVA